MASGIRVARELLGLDDEREVVARATDFVLQLARVPAAGWLRADGETGELFAVAGIERNRLEVRNRVAGRVGWSPQLQLELRERFASMIDVHVDQVQIFGQRDVLMLVPDLDDENRSTVASIADLADEAVGRLRDAASSEPNAADVDEGLAWLAHELRGPLVATRAALDSMISTNRNADEVVEPLRRVHDEIDSVVRMMGPMLSIASGAPMRSRPSDVTALVKSVARSASFEAGGRSLKVSVPRSLVLDIDPEVLRPALTNIVRNALAYSPPSAGVELRAREDDGHLVVDVSDHGPGLTAAERKAIFDRFVRGATGHNRPGAGLGLFIARRMVKTHGGSVDVESEEGVGTTFTVRVPIARHARSLRPA
ncbi:MAG: sensor histidine kinase [Actinomycetota bacterium]